MIIHQEYDPKTYKNDIAVLKLSRSIDFAHKHQHVRCVCEPEPLERINRSSCIVMGWGRINTDPNVLKSSTDLLEAQVPLITNQKCASESDLFNSHWNGIYAVAHIIAQPNDPNNCIYQLSVCAGHPNGGKDACKGDSGKWKTT